MRDDTALGGEVSGLYPGLRCLGMSVARLITESVRGSGIHAGFASQQDRKSHENPASKNNQAPASRISGFQLGNDCQRHHVAFSTSLAFSTSSTHPRGRKSPRVEKV
jgi:hypothetical protein